MPSIRPQPLASKNVQYREIRSPGGDKIGDQNVFSDDLLDDGNNTVGKHLGFCTRVRVTPPNVLDVFQCEATYDLPDGKVTARGLVEIPLPAGKPVTLAISGGTDRYKNLRGQITVTPRATPGEQDYHFDTQG
jgi:hypothetical protein